MVVIHPPGIDMRVRGLHRGRIDNIEAFAVSSKGSCTLCQDTEVVLHAWRVRRCRRLSAPSFNGERERLRTTKGTWGTCGQNAAASGGIEFPEDRHLLPTAKAHASSFPFDGTCRDRCTARAGITELPWSSFHPL